MSIKMRQLNLYYLLQVSYCCLQNVLVANCWADSMSFCCTVDLSSLFDSCKGFMYATSWPLLRSLGRDIIIDLRSFSPRNSTDLVSHVWAHRRWLGDDTTASSGTEARATSLPSEPKANIRRGFADTSLGVNKGTVTNSFPPYEISQGCPDYAHLSKGTSSLKQKCTQSLTSFLGTVFHALSHGAIHFVRSVSSFLIGYWINLC